MPQHKHLPDGENGAYRVVWGPQRFYLSIGWKTLIAFALVVFVPMFGLMHITGFTLRAAMEGESLRALEANLRGAWRVYHERINTVSSSLVQTAASPYVKAALRDGDEQQLTELLRRQEALLPFTDVWLITGPDRRVLVRRSGPIGQRISLNEMIARAYTSAEPITSTELLPSQIFLEENARLRGNLAPEVMTQVVVVPVQDNGEVIGALAGIIMLNEDDWLPNAIHDYLSIDAALFSSLIQESRIIAASQRPNNIWATGLLAPTVLNDHVRSGRIFRGHINVNGIPSFIISEPITNLAGEPIGALSIGVRSDNIEQLIADNARNIYIFLGLGFLLSVVIAYLAYRDTMTPLRALMGAMGSFADGNLNARTDLRTKDEFEGVGEGFNRMAQAVQEHQERVESFNSLTSLLITSLKPRELLQKVLNKVVELTTSQAGVIYLAETDGREQNLSPYVAYAVDLEQMPRLRFGQGLPGEAAVQRRVIHAKQIPSDCKVNVNFGVADTLPKEVALIPIIYQERVLGVMLLGTLNGFRPSEMALLEYMANQVAVVLENALTHQEVERLSITDGLTGVFNRSYITERMEAEFARAQRYHSELSLLMIDVDHFKQINDHYGHQVGDQALIAVADALRRTMRGSDLLGRYGGEEFVVLLPQTGGTDGQVTAEKVRQTIEQLRLSALGGQPVTVSIGLAAYPDDIGSLDDLIRKADEALYRAKAEGRNRVITAA